VDFYLIENQNFKSLARQGCKRKMRAQRRVVFGFFAGCPVAELVEDPSRLGKIAEKPEADSPN
jgi:hypothetical protein